MWLARVNFARSSKESHVLKNWTNETVLIRSFHNLVDCFSFIFDEMRRDAYCLLLSFVCVCVCMCRCICPYVRHLPCECIFTSLMDRKKKVCDRSGISSKLPRNAVTEGQRFESGPFEKFKRVYLQNVDRK